MIWWDTDLTKTSFEPKVLMLKKIKQFNTLIIYRHGKSKSINIAIVSMRKSLEILLRV